MNPRLNFRWALLAVGLLLPAALAAAAGYGSPAAPPASGSSPAGGQRAARYHVAAHYQTAWGAGRRWEAGINRTPRLGRYDGGDVATAEQHAVWARKYGIDSFAVMWIGPGTDAERKLESGLLQARGLGSLRWFVVYDLGVRFAELDRGEARHRRDFGDRRVADTVVRDVEHLARRYFAHPRYLRVGDRPLLYVKEVRSAVGALGRVAARARESALAAGFHVYLVADAVWASQRPVPEREGHFDALTAYQIHDSSVDDEGTRTSLGMAERAFAYFRLWEDWTRGLIVRGTSAQQTPLPIWPSVSPQRGELPAGGGSPPAFAARSKDDWLAALGVARTFADRPSASPRGEPRIVFVTTFNDWSEGTTVEPTVDPPPGANRYPGGEYGFDFLEAIREVFPPQASE